MFSPGDKGTVSNGGKVPGPGTSDPGKAPTTTGDHHSGQGIRRRANEFEWQKHHDYNTADLIAHNKQVHKVDASVTQGRFFAPGENNYMHLIPSPALVKPEGGEVTTGKQEKIRMYQPDSNGYMSTVKDYRHSSENAFRGGAPEQGVPPFVFWGRVPPETAASARTGKNQQNRQASGGSR